MDDLRLSGRIAVVTGGGRGLGRELVRALAGEGADVAFSYRESRRGALEEAEAVRLLGRRAFTGPADARVPGEIAAFVDEAAAALGGCDFLVNNVGVFRRIPLDVPPAWKALRLPKGEAKSEDLRWKLTLDSPLRAQAGELFVSAGTFILKAELGKGSAAHQH